MRMLCDFNSGYCVDCVTDLDCSPDQRCELGACKPRTECRPTSCIAERKNCGTIGDGCGAMLECGVCSGTNICGGAGVANVCGRPGCTPTSCVAEGKNCGTISDGCEGTLECGVCSGAQTCGGPGIANVCTDEICVPTSCERLGKNCGAISDGCGMVLECGTCSGTNTCGGGGTPSVCGCTPITNCGTKCGSIPNGCGGTIQCPACPTEPCKPGRYSGPSTGTYLSPTVSGNIAITATMEFRLVSNGGNVYSISEGTFNGTSPFGVPFTGSVVGTLDCSSGASTGALSGSYNVGSNYVFSGTTSATYSRSTTSFVSGTWNVKESNPAYGGNGTWTASWVGP